MKIGLLFFLSVYLAIPARADHITGGEMYYTVITSSGGQYTYRVTLKLFTECDASRDVDGVATVGIFNRLTGSRITDIGAPLSDFEIIELTNPDPCISNPPRVCFKVSYFNFNVTLPANSDGYILTSQVNYRVNGLANLFSGYNNLGASYSAEIPGTSFNSSFPQNNSAVFTGSDLVVICADHSFSYSFAATDSDNDDLRYSLCDAYTTGAGGGGNIQSPTNPPYQSLPYGSFFSGSTPLGSSVSIDPSTGLITGIAPSEGKYVVTVCVQEVRDNIVIATQRKDIQIRVAPCSIAEASLLPSYMLCDESQTISLINFSSSPLINAYQWDILNESGSPVYSSTEAQVSYTFEDTGTYTVKLYINPGQACSDSTSAQAIVYPGFVAGFNFTGICAGRPTFFSDATSSVYGDVSFWKWEFGQPGSPVNASTIQNPEFTYISNGSSIVSLIAGDNLGCIDTISQSVQILDRPPVNLPYRDTLICNGDQIQLLASGSGVLSWRPSGAINFDGISNPVVSPSVTTTYTVDLNDNGCRNSDSLRIRVVNFVSLQTMADTTTCSGDTIPFRIVSDGLKFSWTPASQLLNPLVQNPLAYSSEPSTVFQVTATIGGCSATDQMVLRTVPYPLAYAGMDTTICFNAKALLNGRTDGSSWLWSPATLVEDVSQLTTLASPKDTIAFVLSAYDTKGCPKPGRDTVIVAVLPKINAFSGRDTAVIVGQPLQLEASGGVRYLWLPATGLSAADMGNPLAVYDLPSSGIQYKTLVYDEYNCVDSSFLNVRVFATGPSVFVPNAFTPNGDGLNDLLKPIVAGMQKIEQFSIYNRWGLQVFSGDLINNTGWDGSYKGQQQSSDTYVWSVKAIDYLGRTYFRKGSLVLIR